MRPAAAVDENEKEEKRNSGSNVTTKLTSRVNEVEELHPAVNKNETTSSASPLLKEKTKQIK